MRLELHHCEALLAISRSGSISAAARVLGTDQAGLSRMLSRIESDLEVTVFARSTDGVRVTAEGRDVLAAAWVAVDAVERLTAGAVELPLRVVVACSDTEFVSLLRNRHGLDVQLTSDTIGRAAEALVTGAVDVLVAPRFPHVPWPVPDTVWASEVGSETQLVCLPAGHRLAGERTVELRELAGDDWIMPDHEASLASVVGECRTLGGFEPRIRYRSDEQIYQLLAEGRGVGIVSDMAPRSPGCVLRPYAGAAMFREYVCHVPGAVAPERVVQVEDAVRECNAECDRLAAEALAADGYSPGAR